MKKIALAIAASLSAVAIPQWAVAQQGTGASGPKAPDAPRVAVVILQPETVAANPEKYYGSTVDVGAPVSEVYSPRAFTLEEPTGGTTPDILVIAPRETTLSDGQNVVVHGKVRQFNRDEMQKDYPWLSMTSDMEDQYSRRPVIIAEIVRTPEGSDLMPSTAGDAPMQQQPSR
ncbi:MAG: hypothetical protein AB7V27_07080 [Candidatus Binatia bacterium]